MQYKQPKTGHNKCPARRWLYNLVTIVIQRRSSEATKITNLTRTMTENMKP